MEKGKMTLTEIMASLPPTTLANIALAVGNQMRPGIEADEMRALSQLGSAATDQGEAILGVDFWTIYFDQMIEQRGN